MALPALAIPAFAKTAFGFVGQHWKLIVIGLLALSCYHLNSRAVHWHDQTEVCNAGRTADREAFKTAAAEAKAKNLEEVRQIETKWKSTVTETEEKYDAQLTAARADVAAYAARLRYQIAAPNQGGSGKPGVPGTSGTPGGTLGAGGTSLVPVPEADLYICAANTVKAEQWQSFYTSLRTSWPQKSSP
jgi:hypothetical protein